MWSVQIGKFFDRTCKKEASESEKEGKRTVLYA